MAIAKHTTATATAQTRFDALDSKSESALLRSRAVDLQETYPASPTQRVRTTQSKGLNFTQLRKLHPLFQTNFRHKGLSKQGEMMVSNDIRIIMAVKSLMHSLVHMLRRFSEEPEFLAACELSEPDTSRAQRTDCITEA